MESEEDKKRKAFERATKELTGDLVDYESDNEFNGIERKPIGE